MKNNYKLDIYNKEFRAKLKANPKSYIDGIFSNIEYKIIESSKDVTYLVIPHADKAFSNASLKDLSAASGTVGSTGSVGTVGSAGSVFCALGCLGTLGTVSTVGSAGTYGSKD